MTEQTMAGRTVLVTGASDGIGAEAARVLAAEGATVHVTGRSADKLRPVAEAVGTEPLVADFSRLDDVRRLAEQVGERVGSLDLLLNNAGGTFSPARRTHDGHEPRFATITVADGAAPLVALAHRGPDPEIDGRYFSRLTIDGRESRQARDQSLIDGLWERSAQLTGLA